MRQGQATRIQCAHLVIAQGKAVGALESHLATAGIRYAAIGDVSRIGRIGAAAHAARAAVMDMLHGEAASS